MKFLIVLAIVAVASAAPQYLVEPQYMTHHYLEPQYITRQYVEPQYLTRQYVEPQYLTRQYNAEVGTVIEGPKTVSTGPAGVVYHDSGAIIKPEGKMAVNTVQVPVADVKGAWIQY